MTFAMAMLGAAACALAAAPTTAPAVSIRGRIDIKPGLDLQKPDLSRIVVYIASDPALDALPLPAERPAVSQRNKLFTPNFLVVPRGVEVEFPNWDHFDHNVFSRSKAAPAFDLDRYPYGSSKSRKFDKLGIVQVFCNIHPSMRAIIFVTPNNFFCRADAEGRFEIKGLPAGRYDLVAWHERCEEQRKRIDVTTAGPIEILLTLEGSRQSVMDNEASQKRGGYGVERGLGVKREQLDLPVVEGIHPAPNKP